MAPGRGTVPGPAVCVREEGARHPPVLPLSAARVWFLGGGTATVPHGIAERGPVVSQR